MLLNLQEEYNNTNIKGVLDQLDSDLVGLIPVKARIKDGLKAMDVFKATFPAGTLSGAPKIRAMEIIDEFEPVKRGVYGGAVGYFSWNGNMDMAIAIRTAVIKDGMLYIQAGGGFVADSDPELEWKESMNKGRAIFKAVEMVQDKLKG